MVHQKLVYRPELDGLRAIAVMLVIFAHLNWSFFSGGFIGVDVFFVLSGYLITSIISNEINNKNFTFLAFYKRRIIRLLPAYFLVIGVTAIAACFILLPTNLELFSKSLLYSTSFLANVFMWHEVGGYFGIGADTTPLLHLWSLAVEEQFYLIWPIVLLLIFSLFRSKVYRLGTFIAIVLLSLVVSQWGVENYRAASYYLMPTRFFELSLGGLVAFLPKMAQKKWIWNLGSLLGLSLIFYSGVVYSEDMLFPGFNAVLPTIGAFLLIVFSQERGIINTFLSSKVMVSLGKVSYPTYLWHWPIIAFLNVYLIELTLVTSISVILITLFLSYLTYYYVEVPLRLFRIASFRRTLTWLLLAPIGVVLCFSALIFVNQGFKSRFSEGLILKNEALNSFPYKERGRCNEGPVTKPLGPDDCLLGIKKEGVDFLLVGDSHANAQAGFVDVLAKDAELRGYDITQSNTVFLPNIKRTYKLAGKDVEHKNFEKRNQKIKEIISKHRYKFVILGGTFTSHMKHKGFSFINEKMGDPFKVAFQDTLHIIIESGATPIIIAGNPILDGIEYDCSFTNERFNLHSNCKMARETHEKNFANWKSFLNELKITFPSLKVVEIEDLFCDKKYCYTELNNTPLYKDNGHLNYKGSEVLGFEYLKKYSNPLIK